MLALTLDIMIVLLLLITLGAGLRLYGALKIFRVDGNEFQPMVHSLDQATSRAESALGGLRKMAVEVGNKLNKEARSTQRLIDELDFMTKRANQLAEKLEDKIGKARSASSGSPPPNSVDAEEAGAPSSPTDRHAADIRRRLKNLR
ncbi:MAG: DUF6468 domain-containing protein [Pseudomonadota bacterium]